MKPTFSIRVKKQPNPDQWLNRVCQLANHEALAAVTAIVLQSDAATKSKAKWIARLKLSEPRLAYLAVRYARFTWSNNWEILRDELESVALCDRSQIWFHWHRDISDVVQSAEALQHGDADVLWETELIHHAGNSGEELQRRMLKIIRTVPNDKEARLVLRWLDGRQTNHA